MMQRLSTKILLLLICGAILPPLVAAGAQPGQFSGYALFGVGDYRAEISGVEAEKIATQYEQLSVRYDKETVIGDARLGRYKLMLGYEFNAIHPEKVANGVADATISAVDSQKLFYNATVLLAPGALPFRLTLFAHDLHRSTFVESRYDALAVGYQGEGNDLGRMITPDLPIDISNGTVRTIGGTLLVGIRNGSYLGAYRDVLSQLPRLLIDFKQTEGEDRNSKLSPHHYRERNLAFVSLNKKDNWVHYRVYDYADFLNPGHNSTTSQAMLGTIDQNLQRNWINLTNWIKISGDLSFIVEEKAEAEPEETYFLNMMGSGEREGVKSTIFSHFSRSTDGHSISSSTDIPMTMTAELSRDTRIRTRFIYEAEDHSGLDDQSSSSIDPSFTAVVRNSSFRDLYLDSQLELQRSRPLIIKPRLEIEARRQGNNKDGLAARLGAEVSSNRQRNKSFDWLGGYALTVTQAHDETLGGSGSFIQNEIYGRVDKDLTRTLLVGGRSTLTSGSGEGRATVSFRIPTMSGTGPATGANVDSSYAGRLTSGHLSLYLEHRYQRLGNRLELSFDFFAADHVSSKQSTLLHSLSYEEKVHRFDWLSSLMSGDDVESPNTVAFNYLGTAGANSASNSVSWNSKAHYYYDPNRSAGLVLAGTISGVQNDSATIDYTLSEKLFYRIFTTNGIVRRLAEFSEEIGYEKLSASLDGRDSSLYGRFSVFYSPTKYLYGKLRSEIVGYPGSSALQQTRGCEVGLDFEKLMVMASYSQGKKDRESALLPEIEERLWEVKVKKIF